MGRSHTHTRTREGSTKLEDMIRQAMADSMPQGTFVPNLSHVQNMIVAAVAASVDWHEGWAHEE